MQLIIIIKNTLKNEEKADKGFDQGINADTQTKAPPKKMKELVSCQ